MSLIFGSTFLHSMNDTRDYLHNLKLARKLISIAEESSQGEIILKSQLAAIVLYKKVIEHGQLPSDIKSQVSEELEVALCDCYELSPSLLQNALKEFVGSFASSADAPAGGPLSSVVTHFDEFDVWQKTNKLVLSEKK